MMSNLSCDDTPTGDMYIFYNNIDKYLTYEKICTDDNKCDTYGDKCEFKRLPSGEKEDIRTDICKRFKYLIYHIFDEIPQHNSSNEEVDGKYLIYWLNHEIHLRGANICPKDLIQHMMTMDKENTLLRKLRNYMYYIEDDDVKNMNVLYHLYNNYKEMNDIIKSEIPNKETFMKYANNCVDKYKSLDIQCNVRHTNFCNYLNAFKEKYNKIDLNIAELDEWDNRTLPSLNNNEPPKAEITKSSLTNGEHSEIGSNHNTLGSEASIQGLHWTLYKRMYKECILKKIDRLKESKKII
ncbi:hypothetical protein PVBG_06353 [Plasmodium vivax Brazil I]|uniref:Uncharacterized protein n=1 Tax=Plasmodium vivax (strain Brazil I) TaxID=1033975 RepID=A0A0J9VCQ5_PLAV1|nr:hypothetical protein PVBG_06353 [Plasmodium vivax Brazil I]